MRNSRFVVALVAVACAAALPAAAVANNGHGSKRHHGNKGDSTKVRLSPAAGQTAKGAVELKQRAGALSVELRVSGLTPGSFYAADLHAGTCLAQGAVAASFPDIYANERGVAKLVTTVPTAAGANFVAAGYYVDVHTGESGTPLIACGDIKAKVQKSFAKSFLRGPGDARGRAELAQKGSDVSAWLKLRGLTPGAHSVQIYAGTCAAPGAAAASLGDVTVGPDGSALAKVAASSTIPVVGKGYSLYVYAGPSTLPGALVLCGDLHPSWKHGHR